MLRRKATAAWVKININRWRSLNRMVGKFPIAHKISLVLVALSLATLTTLWVIVSSNLYGLLEDMGDAFGRTIVSQMANASAEPILAEDLLSLNVIVSKIQEAPNVRGAVLFDVAENILVQTGEVGEAPSIIRPVAQPREGIYMSAVTFQDVVAGYALIHLDKGRIKTSIESALNWMTLAAIMIMAVCIVIAIYLGKHIAEPVKQLTLAAKAIHDGDLDYRIKQRRLDEIGILIDNFNMMARGLKERRQLEHTFQRYVAPTVASNILSDLENPVVPTQFVNASVLFVDIVGFTSMCERLSANEVVTVLNQYYGYILRAATVYHGTLDKFIGDGAMVIFGSPQVDEEHCLHALLCAELFLQLVDHYNQQRELSGLPIIEFRLGVHTGEMLAGSLGCAERMQYTVIGDTVNIAARLCHLGFPGKVLISKSVFDQGHGKTLLNTDAPFNMDIRGRSGSIPVYVVQSIKAPFNQKIDQQLQRVLNEIEMEEASPISI